MSIGDLLLWILDIALCIIGISLACSSIASLVRCVKRWMGRRGRRAVSLESPGARAQSSPPGRRTVPVGSQVGESEKETGTMIYYASDAWGLKDREYRFNFKKVNGEWRAYILRSPGYGTRSQAGYITHRHFDGDRPYVCWDTRLTRLEDMQAVAKAWADCTQKYIARGTGF